jgi:hypothetical protein
MEAPMPNDRAMLAMLRARYDHDQVSPGVYALTKKIECDISWKQHAGKDRWMLRDARRDRTTIRAN